MNRVMIPLERKRLEGIQTTKGWYEITNHGDVIRCYKCGKEKIMQKFYGNGSKRAGCVKLGTDRRSYSVARMVWQAFRGKIPKGMVVAHKASDKYDDALDNLYLTTMQESGRTYGMANGLCYGREIRTVAKIDREGNILEVYKTMTLAAKANFTNRSSVADRCYKRMKNNWMDDGTTFVFEDEVI